MADYARTVVLVGGPEAGRRVTVLYGNAVTLPERTPLSAVTAPVGSGAVATMSFRMAHYTARRIRVGADREPIVVFGYAPLDDRDVLIELLASYAPQQHDPQAAAQLRNRS